MVGSVLMDRMRTEGDFGGIDATFFSTSQAGQPGPPESGDRPLADAHDLDALSALDVIVTCQGGGYTERVHDELRGRGWRGYWIDAASTLRMRDDAVIVLDPINRDVIDAAIDRGVRTFVGGNCTVSLMLMAVGGLFREGLVRWVTSMTYQAASGAGAANMRELVEQMGSLHDGASAVLGDPAASALRLDQTVTDRLRDPAMPTGHFGHPLAGSLLPWIDREVDGGQSREEWKAMAETNKILGRTGDDAVPIDGTCVRIGAMRCHSQGLTIKLNRDVDLESIQRIIAESNDHVRVIPNDRETTLRELTPTAVTGTLSIPVGRLRKMNLGGRYLNAFTVGDQLLWGAAEPLRRVLRLVGES